MRIIVKVEKWADEEGLEVQEIGRLTLLPKFEGAEFGDFTYVIDEDGKHPKGTRPLRDRGSICQHPLRQTVWALVGRVITEAVFRRSTH